MEAPSVSIGRFRVEAPGATDALGFKKHAASHPRLARRFLSSGKRVGRLSPGWGEMLGPDGSQANIFLNSWNVTGKRPSLKYQSSR